MPHPVALLADGMHILSRVKVLHSYICHCYMLGLRSHVTGRLWTANMMWTAAGCLPISHLGS
jgi:hypothetical protein